MKYENVGIGISTSIFFNLTNKTHVLFGSVFRFCSFRFFFVYFALDKTGPNHQEFRYHTKMMLLAMGCIP